MNDSMTTCGKPSRSRYVQGCRCYMCRVANADYARDYKKSTTAMVSGAATSKARKKVEGWLDEGYPLREICRATGISRSVMNTLLYGKHHNGAKYKNGTYKKSKRMSRENYKKIMKCERICAPRPKQMVDATAFNKSLAYLYAHGVTPYRIAMETGIPLGSIYAMGERETCSYMTLEKFTKAAEKLKSIAAESGGTRSEC